MIRGHCEYSFVLNEASPRSLVCPCLEGQRHPTALLQQRHLSGVAFAPLEAAIQHIKRDRKMVSGSKVTHAPLSHLQLELVFFLHAYMQFAIDPIKLVFRNFLFTESNPPSQPGERNTKPAELHLLMQMIDAHPVLDDIAPPGPESKREFQCSFGIFCRSCAENR